MNKEEAARISTTYNYHEDKCVDCGGANDLRETQNRCSSCQSERDERMSLEYQLRYARSKAT